MRKLWMVLMAAVILTAVVGGEQDAAAAGCRKIGSYCDTGWQCCSRNCEDGGDERAVCLPES